MSRTARIDAARTALLVVLVGVLGLLAAPRAEAGTVLYEDRSHRDPNLNDRVRGQIWAMDDDGSNRRVLASTAANADVEQHGAQAGYIGYREPSTTPQGSGVVFTAQAVGSSSTACNPFTFCSVHFGFSIDGAQVWRDGRLRDLTPRHRYCFNCTTFYSYPEQTNGGEWVGWYEHFQSGDLPVGAAAKSWALGALSGSVGLSPSPCGTQSVGPIAAHPTRAQTVAFTCGPSPGKGPWGVFVGNRDGTGARQIAELPLTNDHAALAWTANGDGLVARSFDEDAPQNAGLYLLSPDASPASQVPQLIVGEPPGAEFRSVNAAGKRILAGVEQGSGDAITTDIWSIAASCRGCSFPANAKRLTGNGVSASPDWTSVQGLGLPQIRTAKPRLRNGARVPVKISCPAGSGPCRGQLKLRTAGKIKLGGSRKRITVAQSAYRLAAGKAKIVSAKLTGSGRALVASRAKLSVKVKVTLRTASRNRNERTVTLRG